MRAILKSGLAAILALCLASPAIAGTLTIGHTVWVGFGPLYLARDLGYFKEGGLTLELPTNADISTSLAAQASGRIDGSAGTVDELLQYRSPEFCFKIVLTLDESHGGDGVLVDKSIHDFADIKGKTVALDEGATSQFWFNYLLKQHGLSQRDVTISSMSADDAAAAFIAGRVPVAVTWEPHLTFARTHNTGRVLVDSSTTPEMITDMVALSCKVIQEKGPDIKALVAGYYKALDFIKTDPVKASAIMAAGVGGFLSKPEDIADAMRGVRFYDKPMNAAFLGTAQKPGGVARTIAVGNEVWGDLGKLKAPVKYDEVIDPSFVAQ